MTRDGTPLRSELLAWELCRGDAFLDSLRHRERSLLLTVAVQFHRQIVQGDQPSDADISIRYFAFMDFNLSRALVRPPTPPSTQAAAHAGLPPQVNCQNHGISLRTLI
ncbi:MAG: hypothetical protein ACRETA_13555 [Gammaproteobacteria bacterium]